MNSNPPKAVLITGATSGIGKATAHYLHNEGYKIFAGTRTADQEVSRDLSSPNLRPITIDVTDSSSIRQARHLVENELRDNQSLAIVNNAGVAYGSPLEAEEMAEIRLQMEVNFFGVVGVIKEFLPLLRQRRGQIVNISSISGKSSMPFNGAYCASKFALEAVTDALRIELKPWRIAVSNVLPGDIGTEIWERAIRSIDTASARWSAEMKDLYEHTVGFMKDEIKTVDGSPPLVVASEVAKLLRAKNPRPRVLVGKKVYFYYFLEKLPTRLRDRVILTRLRKIPPYGGP